MPNTAYPFSSSDTYDGNDDDFLKRAIDDKYEFIGQDFGDDDDLSFIVDVDDEYDLTTGITESP
eukprot:8537163-Ditylum_brightwellii.AAC.1